MIEAREAYRLLAGEYDRAPNPLLALNRRMLPRLLPGVSGCVVLDVAAGTGYWAAWAREREAFAVSVDFCREMLEQGSGGRILGDARALPFATGSVDVVICSFALGYAPECLSELARVTRRGGVVVASDVHPAAIARGWTRSFRSRGEVVEVAHREYSLDELCAPGLEREALIEAGFGAPEREIFEVASKTFPGDAVAMFAARWRRV